MAVDVAVFILCSLSVGLSCAAAAYVSATRELYSDDLEAREALRSEFQASLHKIVEGHNKLVGQMAETGDKVSDLMLRSAMMGKK